jgi:peptide deformylase
VVLEILKYPNQFLKTIAETVENVKSLAIQKIIDDMIETMYYYGGVGLASIQIGIKDSIIVYDSSDEKNDPQVLINPSIEKFESIKIMSNEGCLCLPEIFIPIKRFNKIIVSGQRRDGTSVTFQAEGPISTILQHEIDHLNGTLIVDKLNSLQRKIYKKRLKGLK